MEPAELEALEVALAEHFVAVYGAPSVEAARGVAAEELAQMIELCEDHDPNTLLAVSRELTEAGVREQYSAIKGEDADLTQFAIHVSDE